MRLSHTAPGCRIALAVTATVTLTITLTLTRTRTRTHHHPLHRILPTHPHPRCLHPQRRIAPVAAATSAPGSLLGAPCPSTRHRAQASPRLAQLAWSVHPTTPPTSPFSTTRAIVAALTVAAQHPGGPDPRPPRRSPPLTRPGCRIAPTEASTPLPTASESLVTPQPRLRRCLAPPPKPDDASLATPSS